MFCPALDCVTSKQIKLTCKQQGIKEVNTIPFVYIDLEKVGRSSSRKKTHIYETFQSSYITNVMSGWEAAVSHENQ